MGYARSLLSTFSRPGFAAKHRKPTHLTRIVLSFDPFWMRTFNALLCDASKLWDTASVPNHRRALSYINALKSRTCYFEHISSVVGTAQ
jgi:hypothetical protein